jgi:sensor histidine kinase YesM
MVRVTACQKDSKLILTVEDNGVGLSSDSWEGNRAQPRRSGNAIAGLTPPSTGIGLSNLRERLQALYGSQQKLELIPRGTEGVIVRVEIPARTEASTDLIGDNDLAWPGLVASSSTH